MKGRILMNCITTFFIKRNLKIIWIFILFFTQSYLLAYSDYKSEFPIRSSGSLKFDVDICQLDGPGDSTTIEVIYSVFLTRNISIQSINENITALSIDLKFVDKTGKLVDRIIDNKPVSLFDSLDQSDYLNFLDIKRINILADTVLLSLKIQETKKGKEGEIAQAFKVRKFDSKFSLSDLYFVSHVQRSTGSGNFDKGGVMLIPNPSRLFFVSANSSKLFAYYEINNLTYDLNISNYYETEVAVQDLSGNEIFNEPRKQVKVASKNTSRINVIPISEFSSGVYRLTIGVTDLTSGSKSVVDANFQIDSGDIKETNILPMSEAEEKKYWDQIKYVANDVEKDIFKKLDPLGKQEFLFRFWKLKDNSPKTPQNEFMIEHFRRLAFVQNEIVGGISSDMGRVYIMYGPPVDIERENPMVIGARSIEKWAYAINGRTDFIFLDREGDGKFSLMHSNHRDELFNPNWREQVSGWGDQ